MSKKEPLLYKDFGEILQKRFQFSLFNLLLIIISIFIVAFFAGSTTAGVFQLNPRAFFRTQEGGVSFFGPYDTPTPTTDPIDANCSSVSAKPNPSCSCDWIPQDNKYGWSCLEPTVEPTALPTTENCRSVPPRPGCNCKYGQYGNYYSWVCPEPTKAPTPIPTDRNCQTAPPIPQCKCVVIDDAYKWLCPTPTVYDGATEVPTKAPKGTPTPYNGPTKIITTTPGVTRIITQQPKATSVPRPSPTIAWNPNPTVSRSPRPPGCDARNQGGCNICDCGASGLSAGCQKWCDPGWKPPVCNKVGDPNCDRACNINPQGYAGCKTFCVENPQDCRLIPELLPTRIPPTSVPQGGTGQCQSTYGGYCTSKSGGCSPDEVDRGQAGCWGGLTCCGPKGGGGNCAHDGSACDTCSNACECPAGMGCNGGRCGFARNCE